MGSFKLFEHEFKTALRWSALSRDKNLQDDSCDIMNSALSES